jgi:hypothetical protein
VGSAAAEVMVVLGATIALLVVVDVDADISVILLMMVDGYIYIYMCVCVCVCVCVGMHVCVFLIGHEHRPQNPERYKAENLYRTPSPASGDYGRIFPEPETRTYHPAELGGYGNLRPPTLTPSLPPAHHHPQAQLHHSPATGTSSVAHHSAVGLGVEAMGGVGAEEEEEDSLRVLTSACPQPSAVLPMHLGRPTLTAAPLTLTGEGAHMTNTALAPATFTLMGVSQRTPSDVAARALSAAEITSSLREHQSPSVDDD